MSENLFSNDNVPSSSWMKFETPGNICKGTFVRKYKKEWTGQLPDQVVFELVNASNGNAEISGENNDIGKVDMAEVWSLNVGVKASNSFILSRLQNVKEGDIIGFAFTHELPAKKGMNPAKSIKPFVSPTPDEEYLKNAASDIFDDSGFE